MKIKCLHGYFIFEERNPGEISNFIDLFGLELDLKDQYYTFKDLIDAPEFAIEGSTYLEAPATKTFAGRPWEVMRANALVYDFTTGKVVPILSISRQIEVFQAGRSYISNGMILPGSVVPGGQRVTDYAGSFSFDLMRFKYSEVVAVD